ncbi:unnamed protein product, partial [Didymodactylos carnosus]
MACSVGLLWKLGGEQKFIEKQEEKKASQDKPNADDDETYDIMISYSWKEKELITMIHNRLIDEGYRVWLDKDNMFGSTIERMAEAIERSSFILMSMSSSYKKSPNCQAEAEYAYRRNRCIIPLIGEPNYRADGWLGFIAGSKMYIRFGQDNFEADFQLLIKEIKRNQSINHHQGKVNGEHVKSLQHETKKSSSILDTNVPETSAESTTHENLELVNDTIDVNGEQSTSPITETEDISIDLISNQISHSHDSSIIHSSLLKEESRQTIIYLPLPPSPPPIISIPLPQTRGYSIILNMKKWSAVNVLEFLNDMELDIMAPLCQKMNGSTLIEMHKACDT